MNNEVPTAVFEMDAAMEVPPLTPGVVLADRYRIVSLIGSGGMGEVYRADDLKLGQPVALKFLAPGVATNPRHVEQLVSEVRLGRRVSHPNVCRIHDVGEFSGRPFISMEYIDGEDLASLLRRVGRLPVERARYFAAQMLAGLAAAHDCGVIHRDLKPANVMIDGRGVAHLTDFGLAAGENTADARIAGTLAYMAPEQLEGEHVGRRTDLYAFGLMLYEMLTGRRVFSAGTFDEIVRAHLLPKPRPSLFVPEVDRDVEAAIVSCIEEDPAARPPDARTVAQALGVPDVLAATVAAGATPAPATVAAAEHTAPLSRRTAVLLLATSIVGILGIAAVYDRASMLGQVGLPLSPEVLRETARGIVRRAGYDPHPVDFANGFIVQSGAARGDPDWEAVRRRRPGVVVFWYRQSPTPLVAINANGIVRGPDPPHTVSGMVFLTLERTGLLRSFRAVPPKFSAHRARPPKVDWSPWFGSSGLPFDRFRPVTSVRTPPDAFDERRAWFGTYGDPAETPVRVEAASFDGKPVWFSVVDSPEAPAAASSSNRSRFADWIYALLYVTVNAFAVILVRRHIRHGRIDYAGAMKVAGFVASIRVTDGLLAASHVPILWAEWPILTRHLAMALFTGTQTGLGYLAVEPYVRKEWPELLVTFIRLLRGRVRDAIVGRDLLVGFAAGVFAVLAGGAVVLAAQFTAPSLMDTPQMWRLSSARWLIAAVISAQSTALLFAFGFLLALFLAFLAVRRRGVATVIAVAVIGLAFADWDSDQLAIAITVSIAATSLFAWLLLRFGLLALATCYAVGLSLIRLPLTLNSTVWYAAHTVWAFTFLIVAAATVFGVASLAVAPQRVANSGPFPHAVRL